MEARGQPQKYKTARQMQEAADSYFLKCKGKALTDPDGNMVLDKQGQPVCPDAKPPTVSGLAVALGFNSRQELLNFQGKKKMAQVLARAKARVEEYTEAQLFDRNSFTGAKFSLMNNFGGWSEKTEAQKTTAENSSRLNLPATVIAPSFIAPLIDIHSGGHTEYVFTGGRGSTKSSFVSLVITELLCNNPQMHACVCRRVGHTLRDSVYAQMCWAIAALGLEEQFECRVSPMEIKYRPTGQHIYFRGVDEPSKLKSIKPPFGYIGILWFEELDQYAGENQVRNAEQSVIRGGDRAYIFKSFNPPKTQANWANKYIKIPKETRLVHHSCYTDVPRAWLGRTFLEEAEHLKAINPKAYEHEYLGVPNATGGSVFDNIRCCGISTEQINAFDRRYRGIDWGWYPDPFAYNDMHYDAARRRLYIFDEIHVNKKSNRQTADLLLEHGVRLDDPITADSAEMKSVGDYKSYGFSVRGAKKGPGSVDYSMKWLQSLTEIVIDPVRCPGTAQEFLGYEYMRDKNDDVISGYPDKDNHHIDAVRYALENIWKRRGE